MEKTQQEQPTLIEDVSFALTQIESMLKNNNSMLAEKIAEGDITASSVAFSNAILISFISKLVNDHPEIKNYINSDEFKEKINSVLSPQTTTTTNLFETKKTDLN